MDAEPLLLNLHEIDTELLCSILKGAWTKELQTELVQRLQNSTVLLSGLATYEFHQDAKGQAYADSSFYEIKDGVYEIWDVVLFDNLDENEPPQDFGFIISQTQLHEEDESVRFIPSGAIENIDILKGGIQIDSARTAIMRLGYQALELPE